MDELNRVCDWNAERILGSGGFGIVTLWTNHISGDSLAIKKCKWNLQSNLTAKQRERWISEVQMMKKINNENIVHFCNIPEALEMALLKNNPSKLPILSMEYCSLGNLRDVLLKAKNCCGLPEKNIIYILSDISNALIYLHDLKITHRDVKPENIVLQKSSLRKLGVTYKLIDLGYAKELNSETVSFVGTLQYLAPEIFVRQNYDCTVDYWSLGIMAFEIICGIRPFLPSYNPMQSYKQVQNKESDVICMQFTHAGNITCTKELPEENQLNDCLKQLLEKWFKCVLQFDPQQRHVLGFNNIGIFQYLEQILATKIITVFSIFTYSFYSYEISDSTLFSTLENWIARDTKSNRSDLYLLTTRKCESTYAKDFYDEENADAMIFVFKKTSTINNPIFAKLSQLIKLVFNNIKTELKFGTFRMIYAHAISFILQEKKHLSALKAAITLERNFLNKALSEEFKLFKNVRHLLTTYLGEIQFYNKIYHEVVANRRANLSIFVKEFHEYASKLKRLVDITNVLNSRHRVLIERKTKMQQLTSVILNKLSDYDFNQWYAAAKESYYKIVEDPPRTNLVITPLLLNILSSTIKIRDTVLNDKVLLNYLKCMNKCHIEFRQLVACRISIQESINSIKDKLRTLVIKMLTAPRIRETLKGEIGCERDSTAALIAENVSLRYKWQELLNVSILQCKRMLNDFDENAF